ncbi:MAG: hypothetical protein ACI3YC_05550 [Alloprevotella sp.]
MLKKITKAVKIRRKLIAELIKQRAASQNEEIKVEPQAQPEENCEDEKDYIREALRRLGCTWEEKEEDNEDLVIFIAKFQTALFLIHYSKEHEIVRFSFPHFYCVEPDYIDILRTCCNESNANYSSLTVTYSFSEDESTLRVSLSANLLPDVINEHFDMTLDQLFCMAFAQKRRFVLEFERYKQYIQSKEVLDLEYQYHTDKRISILLAESEVYHSNKDLKLKRLKPELPPYTLEEWMQQLNLLQGARLLKLTRIDDKDELRVVAEQDNLIRLYTFLEVMRGAEVGKRVSFILEYVPPFLTDKEPVTKREMFLNLRCEKVTREAIYVRVTYSLEEDTPDYTDSISALEEKEMTVGQSMLMTLDLVSESRAEAEFKYMYGEAFDKANANRINDLTDAEKILIEIDSPDEAYHMYWGMRFIREERYFDALRQFQRLWNLINQDLERDRENKTFRTYEKTAYFLGVCYQKLKLYKPAFYYLSVNASSSNLTYLRAFIDCLVQSQDFRANQFVRHYMQQMQEAIQKAEWNDMEAPENAVEFLNHLRKLDVRLEVDYGDILNAERTLKEMLREEDMADFAQNELDYLRSFRKLEKGDASEADSSNAKSN